MNREKLFLVVIIILVIGLGVSWSAFHDARGALDRKAQRAIDYMEIQNLIAKHTYYYAAQKQWEELENVWAKKRDDISYGHNQGIFMGRESVYNYYGKMNEDRRKEYLDMISNIYPEVENVEDNLGVGDMVLHTFTTPDIQIAEDGQTAQGIWVSIGLSARVQEDGKPQYGWPWEKFGVDFIKEDGEWKIWHLQIYTEKVFMFSDLGSGGPGGEPGAAGPPDAGQPPQGERGEGAPPGMEPVQFDIDEQMYEQYSPTKVPTLEPRLPKPYGTWEETTPYTSR
jgi:hypothetical protein